MIKTFRFALLACGLVGGALTATAAPACRSASPRLNWLLMLKNALSPGGSGGDPAPSTFARAHRRVIVQRHFPDGQYVAEGDLLFTLDDAQPARRWPGAGRAEKRRSLATSVAAVAYSLCERLINNHSISRNDVDTARMQRDVAAAAVQQAKARVEAQQIVLSYTPHCGAGDRSRGP